MKRFFLSIAISALLLGGLLSVSNAEATPKSPVGKVVSCSTIFRTLTVIKGTPLPCLDGGKAMTFESLRGPVVVNVWGSWCAPCIEEMPHFRALAAKNKVSIVGIDVEERNMAAGRKFVINHGMNWPNLYDQDSRTKAIFGFGVPVTWFIDAAGKVVYKKIGTIHSDKILFDLVNKYLKVKI